MVALVDTADHGVALAEDQPLIHSFSPSTKQAKSLLESESLHLSTARLRSPSMTSSTSSSTSSSSPDSGSVGDEEVQVQPQNHAAAFYANVDQAFSCIQRACLRVQWAHGGKKVMQTIV